MRAEVRTSRLGLLLAALLVLVAVVAPAMPGGGAATHSPVDGPTVSTASTASPVYDEPHDPPRGPVTVGFAPTTATPDTWWVVWPSANTGNARQARSPAARFDSTVTPAAAPTPRSSRAPPRA